MATLMACVLLWRGELAKIRRPSGYPRNSSYTYTIAVGAFPAVEPTMGSELEIQGTRTTGAMKDATMDEKLKGMSKQDSRLASTVRTLQDGEQGLDPLTKTEDEEALKTLQTDLGEWEELYQVQTTQDAWDVRFTGDIQQDLDQWKELSQKEESDLPQDVQDQLTRWRTATSPPPPKPIEDPLDNLQSDLNSWEHWQLLKDSLPNSDNYDFKLDIQQDVDDWKEATGQQETDLPDSVQAQLTSWRDAQATGETPATGETTPEADSPQVLQQHLQNHLNDWEVWQQAKALSPEDTAEFSADILQDLERWEQASQQDETALPDSVQTQLASWRDAQATGETPATGEATPEADSPEVLQQHLQNHLEEWRVWQEAKALSPEDTAAFAWDIQSDLDRWEQASQQDETALPDTIQAQLMGWREDQPPTEELSASDLETNLTNDLQAWCSFHQLLRPEDKNMQFPHDIEEDFQRWKAASQLPESSLSTEVQGQLTSWRNEVNKVEGGIGWEEACDTNPASPDELKDKLQEDLLHWQELQQLHPDSPDPNEKKYREDIQKDLDQWKAAAQQDETALPTSLQDQLATWRASFNDTEQNSGGQANVDGETPETLQAKLQTHLNDWEIWKQAKQDSPEDTAEFSADILQDLEHWEQASQQDETALPDTMQAQLTAWRNDQPPAEELTISDLEAKLTDDLQAWCDFHTLLGPEDKNMQFPHDIEKDYQSWKVVSQLPDSSLSSEVQGRLAAWRNEAYQRDGDIGWSDVCTNFASPDELQDKLQEDLLHWQELHELHPDSSDPNEKKYREDIQNDLDRWKVATRQDETALPTSLQDQLATWRTSFNNTEQNTGKDIADIENELEQEEKEEEKEEEKIEEEVEKEGFKDGTEPIDDDSDMPIEVEGDDDVFTANDSTAAPVANDDNVGDDNVNAGDDNVDDDNAGDDNVDDDNAGDDNVDDDNAGDDNVDDDNAGDGNVDDDNAGDDNVDDDNAGDDNVDDDNAGDDNIGDDDGQVAASQSPTLSPTIAGTTTATTGTTQQITETQGVDGGTIIGPGDSESHAPSPAPWDTSGPPFSLKPSDHCSSFKGLSLMDKVECEFDEHTILFMLVVAIFPMVLIVCLRKHCCRSKSADTRGEYRAVAAQYGDMSFDNTFSDTLSDDEDGDVEDSWGKSGKRVLEMGNLGKVDGRNGGLSLEEMNG